MGSFYSVVSHHKKGMNLRLAFCFSSSGYVAFLSMLLFGSVAPAISAAEEKAPWYVGSLSGELRDGSQSMVATVNCKVDLACDTTIEVIGEPQSPRHRERTGKATLLRDVDIANNNLRYTRNHLKAHPDALHDKNDGVALLSMKTVLESSNELTACIDVSTEQRTGFLLCKLSAEDSSTPTALLLMTTMNPTCGRRPFCAYFFVPLNRLAQKNGG